MAGGLLSLVARNRRRYGGYVVHASMVLLAIGIAGSSAYDTVPRGEAGTGESLEAVRLHGDVHGSARAEAANATEIPRQLDVSRDGETIWARSRPGKNAYPIEDQVSNEVGIRSDWLRAEDLVRDRRAGQRRRLRAVPRLRQAARQPDLARGLRLPARFGNRALA